MVYKKLVPRPGKIKINDKFHLFEVMDYSQEWTRIKAYTADGLRVESIHSVPTKLKEYTESVKTGGNIYRLFRSVEIY